MPVTLVTPTLQRLAPRDTNNMKTILIAFIALGCNALIMATPNSPSNLTATADSCTSITISWMDNSSDEDGFKMERCKGGGLQPRRQRLDTAPTHFKRPCAARQGRSDRGH